MDNTRLPKHALNYRPRGRRDRGRPRKRRQCVDAGTGQTTKSTEEDDDDITAYLIQFVFNCGHNSLFLLEILVLFYYSLLYSDFYSKTNQLHQCIKSIYIGMTLYMFRTIFPSTISSSRQYIQQPNRYCCLFDKCLLLYVQSWTADDGQKDRPKHVECHSKIKQIWYIGASGWFYCRNNITDARPFERQNYILIIDDTCERPPQFTLPYCLCYIDLEQRANSNIQWSIPLYVAVFRGTVQHCRPHSVPGGSRIPYSNKKNTINVLFYY